MASRFHPTGFAGDPPTTVEMTPPLVAELYQCLGNSASSQTVGIFGWGGASASDYNTTLAQWQSFRPNVQQILVDNAMQVLGGTDVGEEILDIVMVSSFSDAQIAVYQPPPNSNANNWVDTLARMIHPDPGDPVCDILTFSDHLHRRC